MPKKPKVVIIQELLAHYRIPFYERLRATLSAAGVDLELVHGHATGARAMRRDEASLDWATLIDNRVIGNTSGRNVVWQNVWASIEGADMVIVEHANRQLVNYLLIIRRKLRRKPKIAFWGHGANLQSANPNNLREKFKRWTLHMPDWYFAYTHGCADRVTRVGFPAERVTVVQNATDASIHWKEKSSNPGAACVYVGSLHEHKRIHFLLDAADQIADLMPGFTLTIAGDGPLRSAVEQASLERPWLTYRGPVFGCAKSCLVHDASLMLMPGLVGLGILDAFVGRSPLVTTQIPWHSPEIEYAIDGVNALILPETTTATDYALAVSALLRDSERLRRLRRGCAVAANNFTLGAMTDRYAEGVLNALSTPPRH